MLSSRLSVRSIFGYKQAASLCLKPANRLIKNFYSTIPEGETPEPAENINAPIPKINKSLLSLTMSEGSDLTELELQDKFIRSKMKDLETKAEVKTISNLPLYRSNGKVTIRRPGCTNVKIIHHKHLYMGKPVLSLTKTLQRTGGRDSNTGKITVRHIGGGNKKKLRLVDYKRMETGKHKVQRIEYDPVRTAHLALIQNMSSFELSYIIAPDGLRRGDIVESFRRGIPEDIIKKIKDLSSSSHDPNAPLDYSLLMQQIIQRGNCLPIRSIPLGTVIHNVGITAKDDAKLCRAAGTFARLISKDDMKAVVALNSGEHRYIDIDAQATIGMVSNIEHTMESLGKAGKNRWRGIRPRVRGVAMNKCDHPHGGGRGKSKSNKLSQSYSGVLAKGYKTRRSKHTNNGLKVKDRRD